MSNVRGIGLTWLEFCDFINSELAADQLTNPNLSSININGNRLSKRILTRDIILTDMYFHGSGDLAIYTASDETAIHCNSIMAKLASRYYAIHGCLECGEKECSDNCTMRFINKDLADRIHGPPT